MTLSMVVAAFLAAAPAPAPKGQTPAPAGVPAHVEAPPTVPLPPPPAPRAPRVAARQKVAVMEIRAVQGVSTGTAEILGRADFGAVSGALTTVAMLPRTAAPLLLAMIWDGAGGYGPVPWILAGMGSAALAGFAFAARRAEGGISDR